MALLVYCLTKVFIIWRFHCTPLVGKAITQYITSLLQLILHQHMGGAEENGSLKSNSRSKRNSGLLLLRWRQLVTKDPRSPEVLVS